MLMLISRILSINNNVYSFKAPSTQLSTSPRRWCHFSRVWVLLLPRAGQQSAVGYQCNDSHHNHNMTLSSASKQTFVLCTLSLALHDHSIYEPLPSVDMLVVSSAVSTVSHHRCNRLRTEGSQYPSIVIILHEEILLWLLTKHSLIV